MAITFVLGTSVAGTSGGGADAFVAVTDAENTTGADFFAAAQGWYVGFAPTMAMSDSKSNSWSNGTAQETSNGRDARVGYSVPSSVGSGHTFTFESVDNAGYPALVVGAFAGVAQTSPLDQQNGIDADAVEAIQAGSVTPSETGELIIAVLSLGPGYTSGIAIDSGFTIVATKVDGANNVFTALAYKIKADATAEDPEWTWTGAADAAATIATFKAAGAAPSGNPYYAYAQQ